MRLKRLHLQGYKTFANRTEFIFDSGITAIVGPNGSGKSNIADAVRWILGEQSTRELRARRSADMIFSGSQKRPRAGMAHASLVLDNSDGGLPIAYSEVEIGRRVYRDGQSEYYLNGQRVRLKDITALLATSGLAERTYTMIGQGLVDRALSLKADERRALFEEAAGISHYKARRSETLRRLEETQRNLQRVRDILAEIRPRLRSLERQANRARTYEQIRTDLNELLRVWYGYQWEHMRHALRDRREAAEAAAARWQASRRQLQGLTDRIETVRDALNRSQAKLQTLETERDACRTNIERARRDVAVLEERHAAARAQAAELARDIPLLAEERTAAEAALEDAAQMLAEAQAEMEKVADRFAAFETGYRAEAATRQAHEANVVRLRDKISRERRAEDQRDGQLAQLKEQLTEQSAAAPEDKSLTPLNEQRAALQAQLATVSEARDAQRTARVGAQQARQKQVRALKDARRAQQSATQDAIRREKEVTRLETRVELLDKQRRQQKSNRGRAQVRQIFANGLELPDDVRTAAEAALAEELGTLLVSDEADVWEIVRANEQRRVLVATADYPETDDTRPEIDHTGFQGWLDEQVTVPAAVAAWGRHFFGRVAVAASADAAYAIARTLPPGYRAVTTSGLVVHSGGLVETGRATTRSAALEREQEWRAASADLNDARQKLLAAQAAADERQSAVEALQADVNALGDDERRYNVQEQTEQRRATELERQLDRLEQQIAFAQQQHARRERDRARLGARIVELEEEQNAGQARLADAEAALAAAEKALAALPRQATEQQRAQLMQQLETRRTVVSGRQAVVDSRRATYAQVDSRLRRQKQRLEAIALDEIAAELAAARAALKTAAAQMEAVEGQFIPLQAQRRQQIQEVSDAESHLARDQRAAQQLETAYTEARVELTQQENRLDGLRDRIKADLGLVDLTYDEEDTVQSPLPIHEVVERLPVVEQLPDGIEDSISRRRAQLQRIGAINPDAPQEFVETQERHDFLVQQMADLNKTEAQLREVIDELDELTSRAFAETVEQVNGVFSDMFTRLFGGGSAQLNLTEPDDLTITGVDIMARLPGRRPQGLALLSGGERSLTAAALIFALLTVAPPPFCVMDEVDAALDEANINRFRDVLRELSLETQFIVITHNRGTVQAAETLYGISMNADGTSQVISIRADSYASADEVAV